MPSRFIHHEILRAIFYNYNYQSAMACGMKRAPVILSVCLCGSPVVVYKHSSGGWKRRWNDLIFSDLKHCDLHVGWREQAQEPSLWCGLVNIGAERILMVRWRPQRHKDEWRRKETSNTDMREWRCGQPGCSIVGQSKASLVNHTRLRHISQCSQACSALTVESVVSNKA